MNTDTVNNETTEAAHPADLFAELETAKHNVRWLLDHPDGLVDMHGLEYWAGVVARLRKRLQEAL